MKNDNKPDSPGDLSTKFGVLFDSTIDEWYAAKHPRPSQSEVEFINSLEVSTCPNCGSADLKRDGRSTRTGLVMRQCRNCGKKFSPLTGTLFDSRKIPISEWFEYCIHLFQFHSVRTASRDNRNADSTGRYWLSKVFIALEDYQKDTVLSDRVYIDETYVHKWLTKSRKLKGGKLPSGLSRNQICIATARSSDRCYLAVAGVGKPSSRKVIRAYSGHIQQGSTLVHDGENSHHALVDLLHLKEEVHTTSETKGLKDEDNPLRDINSLHRELKDFLRKHPGYSREGLQGWLNLFAFDFNTPGDAFEKSKALIAYAVKKRAVLRYRAWAKGRKT